MAQSIIGSGKTRLRWVVLFLGTCELITARVGVGLVKYITFLPKYFQLVSHV